MKRTVQVDAVEAALGSYVQFWRTRGASERNNTLWLSGVPDRCGSVRGSNLQSKDARRVLYIEYVTPEVTADGLELTVAWQRSSGPTQPLVIACHSLGLL